MIYYWLKPFHIKIQFHGYYSYFVPILSAICLALFGLTLRKIAYHKPSEMSSKDLILSLLYYESLLSCALGTYMSCIMGIKWTYGTWLETVVWIGVLSLFSYGLFALWCRSWMDIHYWSVFTTAMLCYGIIWLVAPLLQYWLLPWLFHNVWMLFLFTVLVGAVLIITNTGLIIMGERYTQKLTETEISKKQDRVFQDPNHERTPLLPNKRKIT